MDKRFVAKELLKIAKELLSFKLDISGDLTDVLEGLVVSSKHLSDAEIAFAAQSDPGTARMMREEGMKERDLIEFIKEAKRIYR